MSTRTNNTPLVSIALCTYNGGRFLRAQLDTLVNQTYKNLEIIAVDDCSGDDTFAILTTYAERYPNFIVYENEQNKGFLKNFETAALYCNGEFIAFSDQDDLWDLQKIELMVNAIGDNQLLYHDSEMINDNDESLGKKMTDVFNFYRGDRPEVFLFNNCISGHATLIRKELIGHAFPLKENYYHDWWLAYVATNIGSIDFLPQALVKYRQHEESNTDLLRMGEKKNERNNLPLNDKISLEIGWLEHCLNYPENKDANFVKTLLELYLARYNSIISIRYYLFIKKHKDLLFYINNNDEKWKERQIKKLMWGLKAKNFWYTYIRQDKKKILNPGNF